MKHYHGLPAWPNTVAVVTVQGGFAFVSFARPDQLAIALEVACGIAFDNGAFSAWKNGTPITDWKPYYEWIGELQRYPQFEFAVIPDVIDGTEEENDALLAEWPWRTTAPHIGAPVWHMHESLARLARLALQWPRVCIGSSGEYSAVGTAKWWTRMAEAMDVVCDRQGLPVCKLHGLRMLDPDIFTRLPLASADSTNIAQNVGIDQKWKGPYSPANKEARAMVLRGRIEAHQSPTFWDREAAPIQQGLFGEAA